MAERIGKKKTTIYDIAAAVDASVSTVSLVLNGDWSRYRIKEETSERILKTARELGYEVNLRARGLRLSKSGLAGMYGHETGHALGIHGTGPMTTSFKLGTDDESIGRREKLFQIFCGHAGAQINRQVRVLLNFDDI